MITRRFFIAGLAVLTSGHASAQTSSEFTVYKDPSCGCCGAWVDHIKAAGFQVKVVEAPDMNRVKVRLGVPQALASCHTGEFEGYVFEGHVPAPEIKRLLQEKPQARGLAVPGMPVGSPGMEVGGMAPEEFEVVLFGSSLNRTYAKYKGDKAL